MNHAELFDRLDTIREKTLILLDPLTDEQLLQPKTLGDWSIRDYLVHLTIREAELVTGLMKLNQNKKPAKLLAAINQSKINSNAGIIANQDRSLDVIFDDWQRARFHLENWLEEFSKQELTNPKRFKWFKGKPLWQIIAACTFDHEAEFLPALEKTTWFKNT